MGVYTKTVIRFAALIMIPLLGTSHVVFAGNHAESSDPWTGRTGLGIMFINSGNNLNPKGSEKRLDNLDSAAEKELTIIPFILPAATYDAGEPGGFKLYFNTQPAIDEVGSFSLNLGGSYTTGIGIVDISTLFSPFEKVWENPYLLNASRTTSSTSKYGAKFALNRILGSNLYTNVVVMNDDVVDDEIGRIEPDLDRDGQVYAFNVNYRQVFSRAFELRPRFSIRKGEYEGESNSFTKLKLSLDGRYTYQKMTLLPKVAYSYKKNDKVHPIFDATKEENSVELRLLMSYAAPFGLEDWAAQMLLNYSYGDVNIDFFDNEAISTGIFMTYSF